MATIGIHINDEIIYNTDVTAYDYSIGYDRVKTRLTVICDGSETLNHFYLVTDLGAWVHVNRMRNIIDITIDENCSLSDRIARIEFRHTLNANVRMCFNILQDARVYGISIDDSDKEITFDNLLDQSDSEYETATIDVTLDGGLEEFGIMPVKEYVKSDENSNYHEIICDNGLTIYKLGTNKLVIRNYGKASLYYDNYYIITIYHRNDISKTCEIKVKYDLNRDSGFDFGE